MAPSQSKIMQEGRKKRVANVMDHPMAKIAKGTAVFSDEYVEAMAAGKNPPLPKRLDDIVVDDDSSEKENEVIRTYCDAEEKACCPKYSNNPFKFFDDATWTSDGEDIKHYNIFCQGTESSPCSQCSHDSQTKNPPRETPKPKKLLQAKGFHLEDYEGEEDTPQKMPANGAKACKWCHWAPCILDNDEVNDEARILVDNLIAQEKQGVELHYKNYRYALYRMYARALGYRGKRVLLPVCVQAYVDKHFSNKEEERVGFRANRGD